MSDISLESADSLLKLVPASYEERCKPLVDGVRKVRAGAAHLRKEGVRVNGTEKVTCPNFCIICQLFPLLDGEPGGCLPARGCV